MKWEQVFACSADQNDPGFKQTHTMIVTARHVIDPEWAGCSWRNPAAVNVRVNAKDCVPGVSAPPAFGKCPFLLTLTAKKMWLSHADDKVDVALIPIVNLQEAQVVNQDVNSLEVQDFATPEEIQKFHIGISANIISAGWVGPRSLECERNLPGLQVRENLEHLR